MKHVGEFGDGEDSIEGMREERRRREQVQAGTRKAQGI